MPPHALPRLTHPSGDPAGSVKGMRRVVDLDLQGNELASLPAGRLSALSELESLTLTGNRLRALPSDLARCERLRTIYAGANDITDATPALEPPCALHAGLAHNRIAALPPPEACRGAEAMLSLDLSGNAIDPNPGSARVPRRVSVPTRALSLAGNPICLVRGYRATVLEALPKLRVLDERPAERPPARDVRGDGGEGAGDDAVAGDAGDASTSASTVTMEVRVGELSIAPDPLPTPPTTPPPETAEDTAAEEDEANDGDGGRGRGRGRRRRRARTRPDCVLGPRPSEGHVGDDRDDEGGARGRCRGRNHG